MEQTLNLPADIIPEFELAPKYADVLETLPNKRVRFWKLSENEFTRVKVYLGDPSAENWFHGSKIATAIATGWLALKLIFARFYKGSIYWIPQGGSEIWSGYAAAMLKKLLTRYRIASTSENT